VIGLVSGLRFVLGKVATAVDAQPDDEEVLRERLLRAQLDLEEGRLGDADFRAVERDVFDRLRAIREERDGDGGEAPEAGPLRVASIEADVGDETSSAEHGERPGPRGRPARRRRP